MTVRTQQAQIIAYIDDYKLLMLATLALIPLLIVFSVVSQGLRDGDLECPTDSDTISPGPQKGGASHGSRLIDAVVCQSR
jgi:hypothetical protein